MQLTNNAIEIQRIRADLWHRVYETTLRLMGSSYSVTARQNADAALSSFDTTGGRKESDE